MANEALNRIRRKLQETVPKEQRKYFKRSKRLMLMLEKHQVKDKDRTTLQVMIE